MRWTNHERCMQISLRLLVLLVGSSVLAGILQAGSDPRLLAVTPLDDAYIEAMKAPSPDDALLRRIDSYRELWREAELARDEANRILAAEIERLEAASGETITREQLFFRASTRARAAMAHYLSAWKRSLAAMQKAEPDEGIAWGDSQTRPKTRDADIDRAHEVASKASMRAEEPFMVEPDDAALQLSSVSLDGAMSQVGTTFPGALPPAAAPRTPTIPLPTPDPANSSPPPSPGTLPPSPGGGTPPPSPGVPAPVPGTPPLPTPNPPGGPVIPGPQPPTPPGGAYCSLEYPLTPDEIQRLFAAAVAGDQRALERMNNANCTYFDRLRVECASDYAEVKRAYEEGLRQAGLPGRFEDYVCLRGGTLPGGGQPAPSPSPGPPVRTTRGAVMVVDQCRNNGFECRESQARPVDLCVPHPAGARVVDYKTQTKYSYESSFSNCAVGSDCEWSRFLVVGRRGDSICTRFVNWSHARQRVIRLEITYEESR